MAQDQADISARSDYGIVNEDHVGFAEEYWLDLCCFLTFFIIVCFCVFLELARLLSYIYYMRNE